MSETKSPDGYSFTTSGSTLTLDSTSGRSYDYVVWDDKNKVASPGDYWNSIPLKERPMPFLMTAESPLWKSLSGEEKSNKKGVDTMYLYEVYLVYAEKRGNPFIWSKKDVIASDDEDAKIKSGVYAQVVSSWDSDYLTIIARQIGAVSVKQKPKEVKNV